MPPAQFNLLSKATFIGPLHPGPLTIPISTTAMSVFIKDQYNEQLRLFREINGVEKALISQIVSAINAEFLIALRNRATNAIPGPVHLVLYYLKDAYVKLPLNCSTKKRHSCAP